ncbi:MAG: hypothetical protein IJB30_03930, partial [Clostridia bacterium]|nr:hypothetical protein [Clostridia bacterium]
MASAAKKDIIREIKNSKNRFLAIMVLSALAVAFLCGLKVTAPDMKGTGDDYLDGQRLMDIQVMSSLGITDEDIAELGGREEIDYAVGAYVMDAWAGDAVAKVYSITDEVNRLVLMEGRMPVVGRECVADEKFLAKIGLTIGDTLPIIPSEDNEDSLIYDDFRIVGTVRSPYYLSVERGSASIGSGSVQGYVYLKETAFNTDCYTIAYLRVKGAEGLTAFTDEYDDYIEDVVDGLEPMGEVRAQLRYDEIIDEAMEEIADAQQELADAEKEVAEEIAEAEQELADARKELDDGWYEYRKGKKELEEAYPDLVEGEEELWDGYYELMDGEEEYADGLKQYEEGRAQFEEEYNKNLALLEQSKTQIDAGFKQIEDYYAGMTALEQGIARCNSNIDDLRQIPPEDEGYAEAQQQIAALEAERDGMQAQLDSLKTNEGAMEEARTSLNEALVQYEQGRAQLDAAKAEMDKAKAELDEARKELNKGWREYREGRQELEDGWNEYY